MPNALRLSSWIAILLVSPGAFAQPVPGVPCGPEVVNGTTYHFENETGDAIPASYCFATGFRCEPPEHNGGPSYQLLDPNCDPTGSTPCKIQVRVPLKFPGNQDNIDEGLHAMEVRWFTEETPPSCSDPVQCGQVSTCGKAFTGLPTINTDRATFTATRSMTCNDILNGSVPLSLTAWSCITSSSCRKRLDVPGLNLDGTNAAKQVGCPIPPQTCNGDPVASCRVCLLGGMGVGGGGAGAGGSGSGGAGGPATGNGAYLYYAAGGAGFAGVPGAATWTTTLGRGWSHDYALRVVSQTTDDSRVALITRYATFRIFWDDDLDGTYDRAAPSNEYRTLTRTAGGWELAELDGTVHAFDASGLWLSTTDRNGNPKTAVYSGGVLSAVQFADGRHEDFTYYPTGDPAEGKLATITQVGVDLVTSRAWSYSWTGDDLTRIDRPDGTAIVYTYDDPAHPGYMTRIELEGTDGTSTRVERAWEYDAQGNAVASWRGDVSKTGPDAVDVWELSFDNPVAPTVTTVTPPPGGSPAWRPGAPSATTR